MPIGSEWWSLLAEFIYIYHFLLVKLQQLLYIKANISNFYAFAT